MSQKLALEDWETVQGKVNCGFGDREITQIGTSVRFDPYGLDDKVFTILLSGSAFVCVSRGLSNTNFYYTHGYNSFSMFQWKLVAINNFGLSDNLLF